MIKFEEFTDWILHGAARGEFGDETEYPIAGCREMLEGIAEKILRREADRVLCIGPGSEQTAIKLYNEGIDVWIVEPLPERLEVLRRVMPEANFIEGDAFDGDAGSFYDIINGPEEDEEDDGQEIEFDAVVWTYLAHRIGSEEKMWILDDLAAILSDDGIVYIGDVCFWTTAEREICRRRCAGSWDSEADYIVYDSFRSEVEKEYGFNDLTRFTRTSHCSGIIEFGLDIEEN